MAILDSVNSPADVKKLSLRESEILAAEIREKLIDVVSKTGGHLASNLGVVELTIALHRVFSSPDDKFVWDVGHQSYVHKMLTGRKNRMDSIRQYDGLSGFTRRSESIHDPFGAGHSGTSISAAAGIASANMLSGNDGNTIAIVGDGAFTGGMIYEALNDCVERNLRLIVVLNDNEMSISPNVGGMSKYLSNILNSEQYFNFKHKTEKAFMSIPYVGKGIAAGAKKTKDFFKRVIVNGNFFENLGWIYYGVVDGNDIYKLETVLREAKKTNKCCLIHIRTKKGKGYAPAEQNPSKFHGVAPFDPRTGESVSSGKKCFSDVFGDAICNIASKDIRICAITAAMGDGTGLRKFKKKYPSRFFDVGIAEEHAATFCAALSTENKRPVFAVYSTFAQRAYDQLLHDAALQKLPMVLALDRAGLVAADGATHHGIFDVSFLGNMPNTEIYSPETYDELVDALKKCLDSPNVAALRYPRDSEREYDRSAFVKLDGMSYCDFGSAPICSIITYGRITENAVIAAKQLSVAGIGVRVIKLIRIKPVAYGELENLILNSGLIYFLEEGIKSGGISETIICELALNNLLSGKRTYINAINDFVAHGDLDSLFKELGFMPEQIASSITELVK